MPFDRSVSIRSRLVWISPRSLMPFQIANIRPNPAEVLKSDGLPLDITLNP